MARPRVEHHEKNSYFKAENLYAAVNIDFVPGLETKLTLPEDIARAQHAHTMYVRAATA